MGKKENSIFVSMGYITDRCRELRNNPTKAEAFLWRSLRERNRSGFRFLRQFPLIVRSVQGRTEFYIADFYCAVAKLVVEVDGGYHENPQQKEDDLQRDRICAQLGLTVLRFKNEEVMGKVSEVLKKIDETLRATHLQPLPTCGK